MILINKQIDHLWVMVKDQIEGEEEAFAVGFLSALKWSSEGLLGLLKEGSEACGIEFVLVDRPLATAKSEERRDVDERTITLHRKVRTIMEADLSWEEKYDLVFGAYQKADVILEWYDPDTSYQEDVEHFVNALETKVEMLLKVRPDLAQDREGE